MTERGAPAVSIARLLARGFRNLAEVELTPSPRVNVLFGDNGQGKSNLLEAVDYLSRLESFRGARAEELLMRGASQARLACEVRGEPVGHSCVVTFARGSSGVSRKVELDGKRPRTRGDQARALPSVLFHPGDMQLVSGAPEARRGFLDRMLEQLDPVYGSTRSAYERALRSRNRLLRAERPDRAAIAAYDPLLAEAGAVLGKARERIVLEITGSAVAAFERMSEARERLALAYEPRVPPEVTKLEAALAHSLDKDLARGFTAEGPHADELGFYLDGAAAKRYASQGQQRSMVLALKLTELSTLEQRLGRLPLLLLDDVSSELDRGRSARFFDEVAELGGQMFVTTTQPELIPLRDGRRDYRVVAGSVTPL